MSSRHPYSVDPYGLNPLPGVRPLPPGPTYPASSGDTGEVVSTLTQWFKSGPSAEGANALLRSLARPGVSQTDMDSLRNALESAYTKGASCPTGPTPNQDEGSADGIDWYEPDEGRFYVLDKRSGAELAAVLDDLKHMRRYLARGSRAPNRLLFIGAPGNGKTAGALWLGSQLKKPVALVRIDGIVHGIAGRKAKNLRACFEAAAEAEAILVIDEFEAIAVSRSGGGPNTPQWDKETTSALLQAIDALPDEQILIGATNVPDAIDTAVQRRLRKHVNFYPPDRDARAAMLTQWWRKAPHESEAKGRLLDLTEGHSGDVLERAAEDANRAAARRDERAKVTVADVDAAMASVLNVPVQQLQQGTTP